MQLCPPFSPQPQPNPSNSPRAISSPPCTRTARPRCVHLRLVVLVLGHRAAVNPQPAV